MGKVRVGAGELSTKITVRAPGVDLRDGFFVDTFTPVFIGAVWCKWTGAHGAEALSANALGLREPVTILMRYSPLVNVRCRIWHEGDSLDTEAYEIISLDVIGDRREFMEIKAQRVVLA